MGSMGRGYLELAPHWSTPGLLCGVQFGGLTIDATARLIDDRYERQGSVWVRRHRGTVLQSSRGPEWRVLGPLATQPPAPPTVDRLASRRPWKEWRARHGWLPSTSAAPPYIHPHLPCCRASRERFSCRFFLARLIFLLAVRRCRPNPPTYSCVGPPHPSPLSYAPAFAPSPVCPTRPVAPLPLPPPPPAAVRRWLADRHCLGVLLWRSHRLQGWSLARAPASWCLWERPPRAGGPPHPPLAGGRARQDGRVRRCGGQHHRRQRPRRRHRPTGRQEGLLRSRGQRPLPSRRPLR